MVPSAVPANGLKPESEGAFNSEATFFVARKKKNTHFIWGKEREMSGMNASEQGLK